MALRLVITWAWLSPRHRPYALPRELGPLVSDRRLVVGLLAAGNRLGKAIACVALGYRCSQDK